MTGRMGLKGQWGALFAQPSLLWEALRAVAALRGRNRLLPSSAYLRWRMETAYGSSNANPEPVDMVHYLRWRRHMRKISGWAT